MAVLSFDNFELGLSGTADLVSRVDDDVLEWFGAPDWAQTIAAANNTDYSAQVYAAQVKDDPTLADSKAIEDAAQNGASPEALGAFAKAAGDSAINNGALEKAAQKTGRDLFNAANPKNYPWLPWVIGGVVALGVVTFAGVAATRTVPRTA